MRESISGIKHPAFRDALSLTRAGARKEMGRYLVEDADMVRQALASPAEVFAVFATPAEAKREAKDEAGNLEAACVTRRVPLYILGSSGLITKLVGTGYETAVGAVAVVGQRRVSPTDLLAPDALILCGERIQDPRNVGVLIRTAEAAGCAGLLLSDDSAEPFSRQAVRSTTGSILRLPLAFAPNLPTALAELAAQGARVVASSGAASALAYDADLSVRPLVLVVGNEQSGITDRLAAAASEIVRLPMAPGGADSLNVTVAAGALVYEAVRQHRRGV